MHRISSNDFIIIQLDVLIPINYRDKDQVEVDLVITRGSKTWGIEVKAAASLAGKDGRGLSRLAGQCGSDFQRGIILYAGQISCAVI